MCAGGFSDRPPESNVMALPTSPSRTSARGGGRLVAQHDQSRLVAAAGAHRSERAHAELVDLPRAENLRRQVLVLAG